MTQFQQKVGKLDAQQNELIELERGGRRSERLADVVYGRLIEQIAGGEFAEGEKLPPEKILAASFMVSRAVVREALARLQSDGVTLSKHGSGTYVKSRPARRLVDLASGREIGMVLRCIEARIPVETENARLAAIRKSKVQMSEIMSIVESMTEEFNSGTLSKPLDFAFHRTIATASQNQYLIAILDQLRVHIEASMDVTLTMTRTSFEVRARQVFEEHRHLAEAIKEGDGDRAGLLMHYHLDQARRRLIDHRRDQATEPHLVTPPSQRA